MHLLLQNNSIVSCEKILSGYLQMGQNLNTITFSPPSLLEIAKNEHGNHKGGKGDGVANGIYDVQAVKHFLGGGKREKFLY